MPADLLKSLLFFNDEKGLFQENEKIGLAVSGGLDSVVLLHLFFQLKEEWSLRFVVLHFDHMLRQESRQDADFVAELCRMNNLPCDIDKKDVAAYAVEHKLSLEMAARECRYAFFQRMHTKHQLNKIATAHNANDQAETILFHIMRGSGVDGLLGIPVQRDFFIRPLLFAQREQLQNYAVEQGLTWREDHSNQEKSFTRNRIRHALLPLMRDEFNPKIITALNRLADSARDSREIIFKAGGDAFAECVRQEGPEKFVLEIDRFLAYLNPLQRLVLQHIFKAAHRRAQDINFNMFEAIQQFLQKKQSGASFSIAENFHLVINGNKAIFERPCQNDYFVSLELSPGRFDLWNHLFVEILEWTAPLTFENKISDVEYIDADQLGKTLCARSFHNADVFYPVNGTGRKKLSDLFIDHKVPFSQRRKIPILESDGRIVWVAGIRLDDRFKVTNKTKRIFKLTIGTRGQ